MKILKILCLLSCFSTIFAASFQLSPEEMATQLNSVLIVRSSDGQVIPFCLDPITNGVEAYQAEAKILTPTEGVKTILLAAGISVCQAIIIRNEVTKRTGLYHVDYFFDLSGIKETLETYRSGADPISVRVVVNDSALNEREFEYKFTNGYQKTAEEHISILMDVFTKAGVAPQLLRLSVVPENLHLLKISQEISNELDEYAYQIAGSLSVSAETGELSWWFHYITRPYVDSKIIESDDLKRQKTFTQVQILAQRRADFSRRSNFGQRGLYGLHQMIGIYK